jgi:hypothetical protein
LALIIENKELSLLWSIWTMTSYGMRYLGYFNLFFDDELIHLSFILIDFKDQKIKIFIKNILLDLNQ